MMENRPTKLAWRACHMAGSETLRLKKSNKLDDPYVAAGDRAYLVGAQDGGFPDFGWHLPGEMGGLWMHPIKLLDGFWLRVGEEWLEGADCFISQAFSNEHRYTLADGHEVVRRQWVPD